MTYKCEEQILFHKDIGIYTTYKITENGCCVMEDVNCCKNIANEIADVLNLNDVELSQARYIIEDLLCK